LVSALFFINRFFNSEVVLSNFAFSTIASCLIEDKM
jgi:hypothetical protein